MIVEVIPDNTALFGKKLLVRGTKREIRDFKQLVGAEPFLSPNNRPTDRYGILPYRTSVEFKTM